MSSINEDIKRIDKELNTKCSERELTYFSQLAENFQECLKFVDAYELNNTKGTVTRDYYTPSSEENPHNAWYVKCNINEKEHGKLSGKTIAIKDNAAVAGLPMMCGSPLMEGYVPEYDCAIAERILSHGGTIVGKTTCEDMCVTCVSYLTKYGPVKNPVNTEHSAGGSSSGSAVVVRNNEADMAIGSDQGGSVRIPSSNCGIVGLKPTFGLVPYTGACSMGAIFDHLGPMARNVADCALLLECIAGYDVGRDGRQTNNIKVLEYSKLIYPIHKPTKKISIGILKESLDLCEAAVQQVFLKAVDKLKSSNHFIVSEISCPIHSDASKVYVVYANSCFYDVLKNNYGSAASMGGLQSHSLAKRLQQGCSKNLYESSPQLRLEMLLGKHTLDRNGTYHAAKCTSIIPQIREEYNKILDNVDLIITPTSTLLPAKIPSENADIAERIDPLLKIAENVEIFNLTGHPALSINCGYFDGLPVGLQIIGKHYDEVNVLSCASIMEKIFD